MQTPSQNWHNSAIDYLLSRTTAPQDVLERFVDLDWDPEDTDEDNLYRFETYHCEYMSVFA